MEKTASMIHEEHGLRIEPGGLLEKILGGTFMSALL
jgi:hypothetical protein